MNVRDFVVKIMPPLELSAVKEDTETAPSLDFAVLFVSAAPPSFLTSATIRY